MFKCKTCLAKDEHIASLKAQIALLSQLTVPNNSPQALPILNLEADAVLTGHQHTIPADHTEMPIDDTDIVLSERDRLLSGSYS
jgi:hypothetical protein